MDSWHHEGIVLPQFQLDYYVALLGMPTISYAADWLQNHAAEGSSAEKMAVSTRIVTAGDVQVHWLGVGGHLLYFGAKVVTVVQCQCTTYGLAPT
jgi:hypothetical protein